MASSSTAISGETIWPTGLDVAAVAGEGKFLYEKKIAQALKGSLQNHVVSGLLIPASSANLNITVPLGEAFVSGHFCELPATQVTFFASVTNNVYVKLTRDGNNKVTGAQYEVNDTGTPPADSLLIARGIANGAAIPSAWLAGRTTPMNEGLPAGAIGLTHEGHVAITANQNYSGIHFCDSFFLAAGVTLTVPDNARQLVIIATGAITINGTIDAVGAGGAGGAGAVAVGGVGIDGTDQPGGNGGGGSSGGGSGGDLLAHGIVIATSGQVAGSSIPGFMLSPWTALGGAGGGGGGGNGSATPGGSGGRGGGSIVLIAPVIILAITAVLNTSGANGAGGADPPAGSTGGGGGGGAGNVYLVAKFYTDLGATFTHSAGSGGSGFDGGSAGGAGAAGTKVVLTGVF